MLSGRAAQSQSNEGQIWIGGCGSDSPIKTATNMGPISPHLSRGPCADSPFSVKLSYLCFLFLFIFASKVSSSHFILSF